MAHTLIVADDLSGAADCAIAFAGEAVVAFADTRADAAVLAIDADTRRTDAQAAAEITHRLFTRHARPDMTLFKKLDSTLRGHVGVEIAAAREALRAFDPLVIVAPAFPATGRVLRQGRLIVNGVPLEETQVGREIEGPTEIAQMLRGAGLEPALVDRAQLRGNIETAMNASDVMVCDAETEDDLHAIAAAGRDLGRTILWAGSGGLARVLGGPKLGAKLELPPLVGNILFLVGSRSDVSRAQAMTLAADTDVTLFSITPAALKDGSAGLPDAVGDLVVMLDAETAMDSQALIQSFAAVTASATARAGALFLTGGETAHAVLTRAGASGLSLLGEIEPGVIVSRAMGGALAGRIVVTKAGAFGEAGALRRVRDVLRRRPAPLG